MKPKTILCLLSLLALPIGEASAQTYFNPSAAHPPRAVRAGDAAYWVGKPQVLVPADVDDLHVSPDRRFVLAICRNPAREPFEEEEAGDASIRGAMDQLPRYLRPRTGIVSIVLFDSVRGRVSTLWKREALADETLVLSELRWLADSKTALATISVITSLPTQMRQSGGKQVPVRPESVNTSLLIISADRRSARPITLLEGNPSDPMVQITPSPIANRALLSVRPRADGPSLFRFIDATGVLTDPISIEIGFSFFSGWTEDGSKITGFAMPNSKSDWKEPKDIEIDARTGVVTLTEKKSADASKPAKKVSIPEWQESARDKEAPIQCFAEKVNVSPQALSGSSFAMTAVLLRSATDPKEAVVVAPDGDPVGIVGDGENRTVLYRSHDALYGVPVRKVPLAEYEAAVRRLAALRASLIHDALEVWRLRHDNLYPNPGSDIAAVLKDTTRSGDTAPDERFLDPVTGKATFTYLYRGSVNGERSPLFSLGTIGGRVVYYTGGYRPHWIADGTPIPATEPSEAN